MLQNATPLRKSAPDLLTALMNMSLVLRLPRKMHLCRSSSNAPHLPSFLDMPQNPHVLLTLTRCTIPCACHAKRHLNVQKWSKHVVFLTLLAWKCASRHNLMHFFEITTSKSGPNMVCFVHFDFQMCFAPQCRALFHHLNFQKWSATTARTFSTSQLPKVVRTWCVLCILTSKCASRHNGVQLFISHPTFRPSGATNHWQKHSVSRLSYLFAGLHLLSSDFFSSLIFSLLLFSSLTLPTSAFPSVHIVGSLTSKLPSSHTNTTTTTLHYKILHYTNYITFHYSYNYNCNYHCVALHYTTPHHTTLHCTTGGTPQQQLQLQLCYTNYTALQPQLHNYHYSYNYNCTTPYYIQQLWWGEHCKHCNHSKKRNSNYLSVHLWVRSAIRDSQQPTSPIGFLSLKLPPPPCAVLLV